MADKRAYFKLDVGYLSNPKVATLAAASPRAVLLHVASIGYSAQHLTNGVVPIALLLRLTGASKRDAARLVEQGLWVDDGNGSAEVHDYLEHQRSADEVKGATEKARRAADARWHTTSNASGNASGMPTAMPREIGEKETTSGRARKRALPDEFRPSEAHQALAVELGIDLRAEWPQFVDHHRSRGSVMKDWDAALRTWIRNAKKFNGTVTPIRQTDEQGRTLLPPLPPRSPWTS